MFTWPTGADKVPYIGATKAVDLGAQHFTTTGIGSFGAGLFSGNVRLGDSTNDIHGINTAPVANRMLTASQRITALNASSWAYLTAVVHLGDSSGAGSFDIGGDRLSIQLSGNDLSGDDNEVIGSYRIINFAPSVVDGANFIYGYRTNIDLNVENIEVGASASTYGFKAAITGDIGKTGDTNNFGIHASVTANADTNYGGWFQASGATINWAIFNAAGNVFLGDDNEKTMWGTTNTDLQIYSDGTNGVFDLTSALLLRPGGDTDDYFSFNTSSHVPTIGTVGSCNLKLTASSGTIEVDDDFLINNAEKINLRDTAIGIYSQADTFLDIFADGGFRVGDSSVGAPTNYTLFGPTGDVSFVGSAGFYPRRIAQSLIPANGTGATQIDVSELMVWAEIDEGKVYIVFNDTTSDVM